MIENIQNIPEYADICIIGAGASGLAAAVSAKRADPSLSVVLLEKNSEPGRKIKATGNGRCNLGNTNCTDFSVVRDFFSSMGVMIRIEDEGRAYPYSGEASAVSETLISEAESLGCLMLCSSCVREVSKDGDDFRIRYILDKKSKPSGGKKGSGKNRAGKTAAADPEMTISAGKLIIAAGGKAGPQFGTTGDGARFAKELGHSVTKLVPALTAVETVEDMTGMEGSRAVCEIGVERDGKLLHKERGEIQFTGYGISGIAVFNMTRYMEIPDGMDISEGFSHYTVVIDFLPDIDDAESMLADIESSTPDGVNPLYTVVKKKVADRIYEQARGDRSRMAELLKRYELRPSNLRGWKYCQVTRGGVELDEINSDSMESMKCRGLYFAGEVIDIDGPCGGYNLENAWTTGIKAGRSAALSFQK